MDTSPDQDFPSSESFVDCAGVRRHFELEVRHLPNHGYAAEAREVTTSEHGGYVFKAFAEASGTMASARLRGKARQGLGQRFLIQDGSTVEMPFERIRERFDSEGVVVDGRLDLRRVPGPSAAVRGMGVRSADPTRAQLVAQAGPDEQRSLWAVSVEMTNNCLRP